MTMSDRENILVVEDQAIIRLDEIRVFQEKGYCVIGAASGEAVRNDPSIDLILMDIDLGTGMNGGGRVSPQRGIAVLDASMNMAFTLHDAHRVVIEEELP
jgi:CheY-like chemotaxis protein